jgi:endonuclease/exonuclease/phosphatase family metal-dependent hydrolase
MRGAVAVFLTAGLLVGAGCSDDTKPVKPDTGTITTDAPQATEPLSFVTFNAGLAAGAVPFAAERRPEIIKAVKALTADVVCLEEVWTDADAQAVIDGLKAEFPFSFREKTEDTSAATVKCTDTAAAQAVINCVTQKCVPAGITVSACVLDAKYCKAEYEVLSDACKLCLAGNTANPLPCAAGGAKDFVYEGRNGLLLLSRLEIKGPSYTAMDTVLIKRGVINARIGTTNVQCTHLPADLGAVPYPTGKTFTSWKTENAGAIGVLVGSTAAGGCTVLMGDMNCGPAQGTLVGELAENYPAFKAGGYNDTWSGPTCTWCKENPLTGSADDRWIDHIMFRSCTKTATYTRILDQQVTIQVSGAPKQTRLSDHYGLRADLK